jgi:hypothetical protein
MIQVLETTPLEQAQLSEGLESIEMVLALCYAKPCQRTALLPWWTYASG